MPPRTDLPPITYTFPSVATHESVATLAGRTCLGFCGRTIRAGQRVVHRYYRDRIEGALHEGCAPWPVRS